MKQVTFSCSSSYPKATIYVFYIRTQFKSSELKLLLNCGEKKKKTMTFYILSFYFSLRSTFYHFTDSLKSDLPWIKAGHK